jgi:PAS domain S-box-containing protein
MALKLLFLSIVPMKTANHNGANGIGPDSSNGKHTGAGRRQSHDRLEQRVAELTAKNAELVQDNKKLANADRRLQAEIAKHQQTEAALRESQALYSSLVDQIPAGVFRKDAEGRYVFANVKFCQLRSVKLGDVLGKLPRELIAITSGGGIKYPNRAQMVATGERDHKLIMETGQSIEEEEQYITPDGKTGHLHAIKLPIFDFAGKVIGTQGLLFDITERKRAEEALQESQALYFSLVEQLPVGVFRKDPAGRYLLVNPWFCQLKGMKAEEFLGKTPEEVAATEAVKQDSIGLAVKYAAAGGGHHEQIMQTGKPIELDEEYTHADGAKKFVHAMKLPIFDLGGKIIGTQGILSDITELKQAEESLDRDRLLLRTVIDNLPDYIYAKDKEGHFVLNNMAHAKSFGATPKEMLDKSDFDFFSPELARQFHEDEQKIIDTGTPVINQEQYKSKRGDKSGEKRWSVSTKVLWRDDQDAVLGTVGVTRDIHEMKLAQEALRQSDEKLQQFATQLERSNRELQDFAYVASHDLQEPLRKIVVFGERLKEKSAGKFDPESLDYLARMQSAANRMQTLINSLLTFSRVTTKAQPFAPVNLAEVAASVVDDLEGRIEQVQGRVEVGALPVIDAEPVQMRQLLQNLIGNALKFRRPEEPPVVKVGAEIFPNPNAPEKKLCRLTVSDNCIGFDEKYLDRIFNVFQRLHTRNEYEGTGMGLAIVKKIALYHGGEVTAKSKPGEGSTFIMTIPAAHPKNPPDETQKKEQQTAPAVLPSTGGA